MLITVISLVIAAGVFLWIFAPLFGQPEQIPQQRGREELMSAVNRSVHELETDLKLEKIQQEDLDVIQKHLEEESSS